MNFSSTRGGQQTDLKGAVSQGLAADGGLFVPDRMPRFEPQDFRGESLPQIAAELLVPFFAGSDLAAELPAICHEALNFPVPLRQLSCSDGNRTSPPR